MEGDGATDFISDVSSGDSSSRATLGVADAEMASDGATGAAGASGTAAPAANEAARAISEADIVKIEGDTLYALSSYSGLTIIDIEDPAALTVLGNYRSTAQPFEMYIEQGTAYIMYSNYGYYEWDEELDTYVNHSTSRMQAVDVSRPSEPRLLGERLMPGEVSDSRKVGDIIYLVTYQTLGCWDCDAQPNIRISSFDVSDPSEFNPVDQAVFASEDEGWGRRSVSASTERMYVSGWAWNDDGTPETATIQVVDISDPAGDIREGTTVEVAGQIESRWQMDEYEGVLRVISQPGDWGSLNVPVLETFRIASATEVTPLASLPMVLPRPEDLQSVRFDGTRAFAVTFEQTDPLFTFDLSDPEQPVQTGELEIPGWLYHMEPRGDRLYALGFDQSVDDGALHVSIFDVSDLNQPTMLDRVNFGGDWGWFAEDQDRIHKLFNLALDEELILLPFSGSGYDEEDCTYDYGSGIQLIDARGDDLTLRGVAPQVGTARRAVLHEDVLFGISDDAVQTFDISDRDAPVLLDRLDVARNVSQLKLLGDKLLRFGQNWWTEEALLDVVELAAAEDASALGVLDLAPLPKMRQESCSDGSYYSSSYFNGEVFTHGDVAFLPRTVYESGSDGSGAWYSTERMSLVKVDLRDEQHPRVLGEIALEPNRTESSDTVYTYSYYAGILQTDSALLIGRTSTTYDRTSGENQESTFSYEIVDLRQGADAQVVTTLEVPHALSQGGWGYGIAGCMLDLAWGWYGGDSGGTVVSGDIVASHHEVPLEDETGRVRYYLDRIDLSDPANPTLMEPVNIPGRVLGYDHELGRVITLDYDAVTLEEGANDWDRCSTLGGEFHVAPELLASGSYNYETAQGTCLRYYKELSSLLVEDGVAQRISRLPIEEAASDGTPRTVDQIAVSDSRLFFQRWSHTGEYYWDVTDPEIVSLGLSSDGTLRQLGHIEPELRQQWGSLVARGNRAFLSGDSHLEVITSASDAALVSTVHELRSWGCYDGSLEVAESNAYCALGQYGVQTIPLR